MIPFVEAPPAPAVSAALTDTEIRVSSGFRGARIVLYGAVFDPKDRPSDIVVIVRGPDQPLRIARKTQVAGLWLNSRPVVFHGAPGFYRVASTRKLQDIAGFAPLRHLGAVLRLKEKAGLYAADPQGVRFVDKGLFRAQLDLPAEAPIGRYSARIVLFQDGKPVSIRDRTLVVEKAGAERALYVFAKDRPWTYGLVSVIVALGAGWAASVAFRRS